MPRLPINTRIRFTKTLDAPASDEHPPIIYALKGDLGIITGHGTTEGYWVKTDNWPNAFGAGPTEFEVIEVP